MKNNNIKNDIISLSKSLMFNLSDDEIDLILNEYSSIEKALLLIKDFNLDDVEPTSFIQPLSIINLNSDEYESYNQEDVFKNSKYFKDHMVVVNDKK